MTPTAEINPFRRARLDAGVSREELAFRAGVSFRQIVRIENGGATPRRATARQLAQALGLDSDTFDALLKEAA